MSVYICQDCGQGIKENLEDNKTVRKSWPSERYEKSFSSLRVHYKTEEEYACFTWEKFIKGHRICQIIHLTDCVRIVIKLYDRKIRKETFI